MAESPASQPSNESGDEANSNAQANKGPAAKDKECQFCHQHFTSSSLGRHLDQFLNKKKPDGIHDVNEIRKLRGGITRRTARSSKREHEDDHSAQQSPAPQATQSPANFDQILNKASGQVELNKWTWQSTGVITDPSVLNNGAPINTSSTPSGTKRSYSTYTSDLSTTVADNARALELSLREVLDTLRVATANASSRPLPFSFDILSQTYPSLCLALLPAPSTLFSPSPFSGPSSIPLVPPGLEQLDPLRHKITRTIEKWKWESLRRAQPTTSNIADEADFLSRSAEQYLETSLRHLELCYSQWLTYSPELRSSLWSIELLRAFKSEQDKLHETEERMQRLQQEANQLQQQVDYLSRCQWPREMAQWPPERVTFDRRMREDLGLVNLARDKNDEASGDFEEGAKKGDLAGDRWDFDKIVNKWKKHVREDRARKAPQPQVLSTPVNDRSPPTLQKSRTDGEVNGNGKEDGAKERRQQPLKRVQLVSDYDEPGNYYSSMR